MNKFFFSKGDLESIKNLVKKYKLKRIYITGNRRAGKSTFCTELISQLNGYLFINLDEERNKYPEKTRNEILSKVIKENKDNSYILEHYQLLDKNYAFEEKNPDTLSVWNKEADILILLDPKGNADPSQKSDFDKLDGETIYCNPATGTYVKYMNKKNESNK